MIRFLFKGLLRDRSRSLFPLLTVAIGVFLTVAMYCYLRGGESMAIDFNADLVTGHVKVMTRAYAAESAQIPNDLALTGIGRWRGSLEAMFPGTDWAPRIRFGGLLDIPDEQGETRAQGPVTGTAADLLSPDSPEIRRLGLDKALARGRLPARPGEILLGDDLARRLGVGPGDTATLIGSTMNGSMAMANYSVAGTLRFGIRALDRMGLIMDLADARTALDMEDAAGELLGYLAGRPYAQATVDDMVRRFEASVPASDGEFAPTMIGLRDQGGLGGMLDQLKGANAAIVAIFMAAMSLILWNAGLMGGLRRYGEIGVRLALGESHGHLYRSLMGEALMIGALGTIAGTAAGLALSYYLQAHGLDISGLFDNAAVMLPSEIRSKVTPAAYAIGFIPGLLSTLIGAAIAGRAVFKRRTARLFQELET